MCCAIKGNTRAKACTQSVEKLVDECLITPLSGWKISRNQDWAISDQYGFGIVVFLSHLWRSACSRVMPPFTKIVEKPVDDCLTSCLSN